MPTIRIASVLPAGFREELERIVFFNPEQPAVAQRVVDLVQRYGVPSIVEDAGGLRFEVRAFGPLQTLYAFDDGTRPSRLVGVAMFTRESSVSLVVLHLAVHEDYTSHGPRAGSGVVAQLVAAIRDAGLRTRGVRRLRVLYPHPTTLELGRGRPRKPVRRPR